MGINFWADLAIPRETIPTRIGVTTCDSSKARTLSVPIVNIAKVLGLCILSISFVHTINDSSVGIQRIISMLSLHVVPPSMVATVMKLIPKNIDYWKKLWYCFSDLACICCGSSIHSRCISIHISICKFVSFSLFILERYLRGPVRSGPVVCTFEIVLVVASIQYAVVPVDCDSDLDSCSLFLFFSFLFFSFLFFSASIDLALERNSPMDCK